MAHYHVWSKEKENEAADSYWVLASSPEEARRLVALNVSGAGGAEDADKFDCALSDKKTPPDGIIYSRLNGTTTIARR